MLALLPFDPVGLARPFGRDGRAGQPALHGGTELGLAAEADDEGDVVELHLVPPPQLSQAAQELELLRPVAPVARRTPLRNDEPGGLEVPDIRGDQPVQAAAWLTV